MQRSDVLHIDSDLLTPPNLHGLNGLKIGLGSALERHAKLKRELQQTLSVIVNLA